MVWRTSQFIPPVYHPMWRSMRTWGHDEYWSKGGRGSAKTTVAANRGIDCLMRDSLANFVCYKKHRVEIEDTVYAEMYKAISRRNWCDLFKFKTSPFEITVRHTGQKIFFEGMDEARSGGRIVKALVPLSETFGYVTALRTITSGRATSSMEYDHHAPLSSSIAKTVLEECKGRVDLV